MILGPYFEPQARGGLTLSYDDEPRLRSSANTDYRPRSKESDSGDRCTDPSSSDRNTRRNLDSRAGGRPALELSFT
jgi:hypothetical protein